MSSCDSCSKPNPKFKCSACKCFLYCSKECSKLHWKSGHREECKAWTARAQEIKIVDERVDAILSKVTTLSSDDVCSICLEELNGANMFALPCNHFLCGICIFQMPATIRSIDGEAIQEPPSCPQCRAALPSIENLVQYLYQSAVELLQRANRRPLSSDKYLLCTFARAQYKLIESFIDKVANVSIDLSNFNLLEVDILLCEGNSEECISAANKLLEGKFPLLQRINLLIQIGKSYILLSKFEDAKVSFISAFRLCEQHMAKETREICHWLSQVFYELKDYNSAINFGITAVKMNRHYDGVYKYLALAYKELGNLKEAIKIMKQAVAYETPWDADSQGPLKSMLQTLELEEAAAEI